MVSRNPQRPMHQQERRVSRPWVCSMRSIFFWLVSSAQAYLSVPKQCSNTRALTVSPSSFGSAVACFAFWWGPLQEKELLALVNEQSFRELSATQNLDAPMYHQVAITRIFEWHLVIFLVFFVFGSKSSFPVRWSSFSAFSPRRIISSIGFIRRARHQIR